MHNETGKPLADAQLEILLAIVHIDWAAKNAGRVLGPRRVRSGLIAINQASRLEYQPLGVIGVIGPWNYPVFTPLGSIVYALAAGNAVVFKPSELTPAVGGWLVSSFGEVVPEQPVLQLITGGGETGQALADYLQYERPHTSNPAIFVRCLRGHDQPITSTAIQKVIKRAGRRIGLMHFSAHALRHTLACRLVENGSSLKEVADVLRHRSLNTTLIYAKLDTPKLSTVPLPWPGSES